MAVLWSVRSLLLSRCRRLMFDLLSRYRLKFDLLAGFGGLDLRLLLD